MKMGKMHNNFPERLWNISENLFLNFYFLNVNISLTIHDLSPKLQISIKNIAVEGTVPQIFNIAPSSLFIKKNKIIF